MEPDKNLHRLLLVGIAYNQNNAGVYGLILQEVDGTRRLPIAIGPQEAHSIEAKLTETIPERPLTHDLMVNIFQTAGIELHHVVLKQLDNGIYAADLYLLQGEEGMVIDSRSSDAIALAIRLNAPIYATEQLLETASFRHKPAPSSRETQEDSTSVNGESSGTETIKSENQSQATGAGDIYAPYRGKDIDTLNALMQKAVEDEKYEEAALIKKVIDDMSNSAASSEKAD